MGHRFWISGIVAAVLYCLLGLLVAISVNCHAGSGLFVSGGNPPSFAIRRSPFDHVDIFPLLIVSQLHPDNEKVGPLQEDDAKNRVVWRIVADPRASSLSDKLERVDYGKVPPGFVQEIPKQGAPEMLQENQMYEARGALSLMGNAAVRFKIIDGKVTRYPLP